METVLILLILLHLHLSIYDSAEVILVVETGESFDPLIVVLDLLDFPFFPFQPSFPTSRILT